MADEEPTIGRPTTEDIPLDQIGKLTNEPSAEGEAGGRGCGRQRMARCEQCGSVQYIQRDTAQYRAYQCNRCSSILIF